MKRNKNFWSYRLHKLGTPKVLRTDRRTDGRTDGRSGPTTRPAFAKATQVTNASRVLIFTSERAIYSSFMKI